MKQLLAVFIVLLFCVSHSQPQESASQLTSKARLDAASGELVTLTNDWTDAINAKDRAKLEALMAPEFALYGWDGELLWAPRSKWLDHLFSHMELKKNAWAIRKPAPRVYGDFAIVTAVGTFVYTEDDGSPSSLNVVTVDIWHRANGRWQVVARNSCQLSPTASPARPCGTPLPVFP